MLMPKIRQKGCKPMYSTRAVLSVLPDASLIDGIVDCYQTTDALKAVGNWKGVVQFQAATRGITDEVQHRKTMVHGIDLGQVWTVRR